MGDIVLSAFLQALFPAIVELVKKELLQLGNDFEATRKRLASNLPMIQAVVDGAGKTPLSYQQKIWMADLKDVVYRASDILDECYCEERRREVISHLASLRNNKIISSANFQRRIFWEQIERDIEYIERRIKELAENRSIFQIEVPQVHKNGGSEESRPSSTSYFSPKLVCGRHDDQDKIVNMLLQSDLKHKNVEVLAILGEAYIGKTTVAQLVINDERVSRHFEKRLWVHVSRDFNIKRITASIIESLQGSPFHSNNLNTFQMHLERQLLGRKFLLVLDNCWEESWHGWEKLKHPLLNGVGGSKILVTTRSMAVARGIGTSEVYQLQSLSDEDCWLLFCKYALGTNIQACNSRHFINCRLIKQAVIQKCKGVPFRAASLGHKVRRVDDKSTCAAILQEDLDSDEFERALESSYAQLESHLKPFFAYSSIVPPKFQFEEEWLIQLWMAQGFIQPNPNSNEAMEDTGRSYFRTLVGRSFFQQALLPGEQHSYTLSWMMHHLAMRVSLEECYIMEASCNLPKKVRHLTVVYNKEIATNLFEKISSSDSSERLHTLIIVGGSADYSLSIPNDLGERFTRLRTLDLSYFGFTGLPRSIGNLIHLRCLQLRGTNIIWLPKSICYLYNLQTLGLRDCYELRGLPSKINNLGKLRHIDLAMTHNPSHGVCSLRCMPQGIGSLTDLRTLSRFVISQRGPHNFHRAGITELANLNNLHGQLIISNLHLVKDAEEASQACLSSKKFLQKLELSWGDNGRPSKQFLQKLELSWGNNGRQPEQILECLNPPSGIKEITISGYAGMACPGWLGSSTYTNLVSVCLYDFKNCIVVPPLGKLPLLENLHLKGWDGLISMNCSEFCGRGTATFRSLKKLHLERLDSFRLWNGDERCALPALLELVVDNCSKLEKITHNLPALEKINVKRSPNFRGL